MQWLNNLLQKLSSILGDRQVSVGLSWPMPSFCYDCGENMKPSEASNFDESEIKDISVSRNFKHAHPELVSRMKTAIESYQRMFPTRQVIVTCTYRSPEAQKKLWLQGRMGNPGQVVTHCDGYQKKSKHNVFPARAVDVAVADGGKTVWDEAVFYPLGNLGKECGLVWAGFWLKFVDMPHFELPEDVE